MKLRGGSPELARQLAMHIIAFAAPRSQTRDEVTEDYVESERSVYEKLPEVESKPEQAREKIVEGMLGKRFFAASPGACSPSRRGSTSRRRPSRQALEEEGLKVLGSSATPWQSDRASHEEAPAAGTGRRPRSSAASC